MYEKLFIIKVNSGDYCTKCNYIKLNWNNNVEMYNKKNCKCNLQEILTLKNFVNKYGEYINDSSLELKYSNFKLQIKNIKYNKYLEIYFHNLNDISHNLKNFSIDNEIITIKMLVPDCHNNPNNYVNKFLNSNHFHDNQCQKYNNHIHHCDYCHHTCEYCHTNDNHNHNHNHTHNDHHKCDCDCYHTQNDSNHDFSKINNDVIDDVVNDVDNCHHIEDNLNFYHPKYLQSHNHNHNHTNENNINMCKKKVLSVGVILTYKFYNLSQDSYKKIVKLFEENIKETHSEDEVIINLFFINDLKGLESYIAYLKKRYYIDAFVCGPLDNIEIEIIRNYINSTETIISVFGSSLLKSSLSKNLISLSPTINLQSDTIVNLFKNKLIPKNKNPKYLITCSNSDLNYSELAISVRNDLINNDKINISPLISYDAKSDFIKNFYEKILNQVREFKEISILDEDIYILFSSSNEIIKIIEYVIENDDEKILESINWISNDKNYFEFIELVTIKDENLNEEVIDYNNLDLLKMFLVKTNYRTIYNDYFKSDNNKKIVSKINNIINTEHPNIFELYDSLNLIVIAFKLLNSHNVKHFNDTIIKSSNIIYGLTGNLSLTDHGSRRYNKYSIKKAGLSLSNIKFIWETEFIFDNIH